MNILLIPACVIIIVILISYLRKPKNKRFYELFEQFPTYPKYPLIGNAHMLFGPLDGLLSKFETIMKPHDRVALWLGPIPCLFLKKHDDIATILTQNTDRDILGTIDNYVGASLLNSKHEEWKRSKKMVASAFGSKMLSRYDKFFKSNALELVEKLKPVASSGKEINVHKLMVKSTVDVVAETLLGVSTKTAGRIAERFCWYIYDATELALKRIQMPWLMLHYINMVYLLIIGKINNVRNAQQYPTMVLKKKMEDYKNSGRDDDEYSDEKSKYLIDSLVGYLFKDPNVTETRVRDELMSMMAAAVSTSPLNTSFVMLMLALHQDIQQKAYEEVSKFRNDDGTLNQHDIYKNMPYLKQCIKESLRKFSPVGFTSRRLHKDIALKDNMIVPANTLVVSFITLANHDPDLYKNPQVYDPEHFNEEAVKMRPKTSDLSFGIGRRNCIGGKYAMLLNKTQLAYILLNYHLSTSVEKFTKEHIYITVGIKSKIGYPIMFTSRR